MPSMSEPLSWGAGPAEASPPYPEGCELAGTCRSLGLWYAIEACANRQLGLALAPVFARSPAAAPPEAFTRLLTLLDELVQKQLPSVARVVRVQSHQQQHWMRAPQGGRVDPLATARAALPTPEAPREWAVTRVERFVDTPNNQLAAAILRQAEARLSQALALYSAAGRRAPASILSANHTLRRFLRDHPLGQVDLSAGADPERYRAAAVRRRVQYRRLASLRGWWERLKETELLTLALLMPGATAAEPLSVNASYELMHSMAMLVALGGGTVRLPWRGRWRPLSGPRCHPERTLRRGRQPPSRSHCDPHSLAGSVAAPSVG
jgi:hypothetical protein